MAIRKWHVGKVILLWVWGVGLSIFSLHILDFIKNMNFILRSLLIVMIIVIPIILSVITWIWLSGKENKHTEEEAWKRQN